MTVEIEKTKLITFSGFIPVIEIPCLESAVVPLLRGHPDNRPTPLERPLDNVNLNINV